MAGRDVVRGGTRRQVLMGAAATAGAAASFKINPIGIARAQGTGTVTLYTSLASQYSNQIADRFNQTNKNGITVKVFYTQARQLYQRVIAEQTAGRVLHDVIELTNVPGFFEMKAKGWLLPYVSKETEAYPANFRDKDGFWVTGRAVSIILGHNSKLLPSPKESWTTLLDPVLAGGKAGLTDPRNVEQSSIFYYVTKTNKDLGPKFWEELAKQAPRFGTSLGQLSGLCVSGEIGAIQATDSHLYPLQYREGAPVKMIYPKEVVPIAIIPIGIPKTAPNPEGAKVFVDWWLSKEGQETVLAVSGGISVRPGVPPLPNTPSQSEIPAYLPPLEELVENQPRFVKEYIEQFKLG
jgi:iron(III) transport system substrate-binding protein